MCNILPDVVLYIFTFICSPLNNVISLRLHFIKLCTRDFSRITFAAKLSTNLVYNSIFVIVYDIFDIIYFFIKKMKLSVFSRLCVTQKSDDQVNTQKYRNSTLIKKKTALGSESADTQNFLDWIW